MLDRSLCATSPPVGILLLFQVRFEDRLQHQHGRCLRYPVANAGNTQRTKLARLLLRDEYLTHHTRLVSRMST